jgi:hypothetical protein
MSAQEWVWRCAQRLRREWPSLAIAELEAVARDLAADPRWRSMAPEQAAVAWLQLGALARSAPE